MICRRYFGYMLAVFFASLFSISLFTDDTYAVADYSETVTNPSGEIFQNCNLSCIQQYDYLIITNDPFLGNNFIAIKANFIISGPSGSTNRTVPFYISAISTYTVIDISRINGVIYTDGTFPSNLPVTFTLTESISSGITPSGTLNIAQNGSYDVTQYAQVDVNIEQEVIYADYHDDLVNINHSIIICAATILVLYFFYCIYRMIIKGSGAK